MAVNFANDNGSVGQTTYAHLQLPTTAIVTQPPFTVLKWVNLTSIGSIGSHLWNVFRMPYQGFGGTHAYGIGVESDGRVFARYLRSPTSAFAYAASNIILNQWCCVVGVFATTSSIKCYLNGVAGTENTDAQLALTLGGTLIGVGIQTSGEWNRPLIGCAGFSYVWDGIVLTDVQIASLAAGADPSTIEPNSLVQSLDMADEATAGVNGSGTNFEVFDPLNVLSNCPDSPPVDSGSGGGEGGEGSGIGQEELDAIRKGRRKGPRPLWETPLDRDGGPKKTNQLWQPGKFFPVDGYVNPPKSKMPKEAPAKLIQPRAEPKRDLPIPSTIQELVQMAQGVTLQNYADLEYDNPELARLLWPLLAKRYQQEMN